MMDKLTPYQKRVQKEEKMRYFFTHTCNSGGLNELLNRYGLVLHNDGTVRDRVASTKLFQ